MIKEFNSDLEQIKNLTNVLDVIDSKIEYNIKFLNSSIESFDSATINASHKALFETENFVLEMENLKKSIESIKVETQKYYEKGKNAMNALLRK